MTFHGGYQAMARYEGMEQLLEQVRERLGVAGERLPAQPVEEEQPAADREYARLLEAVLLVLRDAQQFGDLLNMAARQIDEEQREDLRAMVTRVERELARCHDGLSSTVSVPR